MLEVVTALGPNDPDDGDAGRQARGLAIAAVVHITKNKLAYKVPSQSGPSAYVVNASEHNPCCTCPDFEKRKARCKHVYAVQFLIQREERVDGTVVNTRGVPCNLRPRLARLQRGSDPRGRALRGAAARTMRRCGGAATAPR